MIEMRTLSAWVLNGLGSAVCFAVMSLTIKKLTALVELPVLLFFLFGMTLVGYAVWVRAGGFSFVITKETFFFLVVASLCALAGNYLDVSAVKMAPNPGYASTLKASQIIVITLLAPVVFGSELTLRKILGVVVVFFGVFVVSY